MSMLRGNLPSVLLPLAVQSARWLGGLMASGAGGHGARAGSGAQPVPLMVV